MIGSALPQKKFSLLIILLIATWWRFHALAWVGLEHDEVAHWLINDSILQGNHALYFSEAYGHEAAYHYWQAAFQWLLGDHLWAMRWSSAYLGVMTVAVAYRIGRTWGNEQIALWSSAILAVTFFPIFFSRLALRAIALPVLAGLSAILFWHHATHKRRAFMGGIFAGLAIHTYMASRALFIFYALWLGKVGWQKGRFGRNTALFLAPFLIMGGGLLLYLALNPSAELRVTEINQPLEALRTGDVRPILTNLRLIIGVWGWSGDPLWRQNVAFVPIFGPILALLFYLGVLIALIRRKSAEQFALLWFACAIIPSLVTADAPSTIRIILILPFLGFFPALTLDTLSERYVIPFFSRLSTQNANLSTPNLKNWWITILTIGLCFGSNRTQTLLFDQWPANSEVEFVWQKSLTAMGNAWQSDSSLPTTIIGWTPDSMDEPTLFLTAQERGAWRFTTPDTLILPTATSATVRLWRPRIPDLPLPQPFHTLLTTWGSHEKTETAFAEWVVSAPLARLSAEPPLAIFGDLLALYQIAPCGAEWCSFWRVVGQSNEPLSIFIHALDSADTLIAQSDGLHAPSRFWQKGDWLVRHHDLPISPHWRIGLYNPVNGQRLPTATGEDAFLWSGEAKERP